MSDNSSRLQHCLFAYLGNLSCVSQEKYGGASVCGTDVEGYRNVGLEAYDPPVLRRRRDQFRLLLRTPEHQAI